MVDFKPVTSDLNRTSFKENGNFAGKTAWRENTHTKNGYNDNAIFEEDKDMTIKVTTRYNADGSFAKKSTGVSFDLINVFIDAAAAGKLEDVDHQGFTQENMVAFGKAFNELQKQHTPDNPYDKKYTRMLDKTTFNFTAAEIKYLYEAAGFSLAKKEEPKQEEVKPVEPKKEEPKPVEPKKEEPGEYQIGTEAQIKSKEQEKVLNLIVEQLGVENADNVVIDFGSLQMDKDGNITEKLDFSVNGEQYQIQIGNIKDLKVAKVAKEVKNPEYAKDGKEYETRYNEKTGKTQYRQKGRFLGIHTHKWHDVEDAAPASVEQQNKSAEVQQPAAADTKQEKLNAYYDKQVNKSNYWNGRISIDENLNNPDEFKGSYDKVTTADGKRVARVATYKDGKVEYKYYEVKATEIKTKYGQEYMSIVPDLTKEVKDAQ